MIDNKLKEKINNRLQYIDEKEIKIKFNALTHLRYWNYYNFDYFSKKYNINEIQKFYKENKKILFKNWNKQKTELYNNWSKTKYEQLINIILSYVINKGYNIDEHLVNIENIIKKGINDNKTWNLELLDINIVEKLKQEDIINYEKEITKFQKNDFKNYVYKYIIPNAILNNWKWFFNTKEELSNIADLRYEYWDSLKNMAKKYNKLNTMNFSDINISQIKKNIKEKIELIIILMFLAENVFDSNYKKEFITQFNNILKIESSSILWVMECSYSSIMYAMATWKDEYSINYSATMSPFLFINQIPKLLLYLWKLIWDRDIKKLYN